jgi:cobalamin biosynthesis protein CobD/CbiB
MRAVNDVMFDALREHNRPVHRLGRLARAPFHELAAQYRQDDKLRTWFWRLLGIGVVAALVLAFWTAIYNIIVTLGSIWGMYKLMMILSKE